MDLPKVLRELHEELENIEAAIASLERLQEVGKRRGSPPDWLAGVQPHSRVKPKRKRTDKTTQGDPPGKESV